MPCLQGRSVARESLRATPVREGVDDSARPTPFIRRWHAANSTAAASEREIEGLLASARADPGSRVLVAARGCRAARGGGRVGPALRVARPRWRRAAAGRSSDATPAAPRCCWPRSRAMPTSRSEAPHGWGALRAVGGGLPAFDAGVFVEGLSLGRWLLDAPFCPACGTETETVKAGWARRCPACGREHFPRTDPAVIVAVESEDGERLLLGSNALLGRRPLLLLRGIRRGGRVARGHRLAGDPRGGGGARPRHPLPRIPGVAVSALADGRLPCDGGR